MRRPSGDQAGLDSRAWVVREALEQTAREVGMPEVSVLDPSGAAPYDDRSSAGRREFDGCVDIRVADNSHGGTVTPPPGQLARRVPLGAEDDDAGPRGRGSGLPGSRVRVRERQRCTPRCERLFVERLGNDHTFSSVKKMAAHNREALDAPSGSEA